MTGEHISIEMLSIVYTLSFICNSTPHIFYQSASIIFIENMYRQGYNVYSIDLLDYNLKFTKYLYNYIAQIFAMYHPKRHMLQCVLFYAHFFLYKYD